MVDRGVDLFVFSINKQMIADVALILKKILVGIVVTALPLILLLAALKLTEVALGK